MPAGSPRASDAIQPNCVQQFKDKPCVASRLASGSLHRACTRRSTLAPWHSTHPLHRAQASRAPPASTTPPRVPASSRMSIWPRDKPGSRCVSPHPPHSSSIFPLASCSSQFCVQPCELPCVSRCAFSSRLLCPRPQRLTRFIFRDVPPNLVEAVSTRAAALNRSLSYSCTRAML